MHTLLAELIAAPVCFRGNSAFVTPCQEPFGQNASSEGHLAGI